MTSIGSPCACQGSHPTATLLQPSFIRPPSSVAIRRAETYQADLTSLLFETLKEFNLPVRGKSVLLKPNLVGLDPEALTNTHPAVVGAAREGFLRLGARSVVIGDGPGLERDTEAGCGTPMIKFRGQVHLRWRTSAWKPTDAPCHSWVLRLVGST